MYNSPGPTRTIKPSSFVLSAAKISLKDSDSLALGLKVILAQQLIDELCYETHLTADIYEFISTNLHQYKHATLEFGPVAVEFQLYNTSSSHTGAYQEGVVFKYHFVDNISYTCRRVNVLDTLINTSIVEKKYNAPDLASFM